MGNAGTTPSPPDRFVRLSTELLEALVSSRLTGVELRIILWVVRHTAGWNRNATPFTWYRIAKRLGGNRAVVWRAGRNLIQGNILFLENRQLGIHKDFQWRLPRLAPTRDAARQLWMPGMDVTWEQRRPLPGSNASVAAGQRTRCLEATLFRRAKHSSKDRLKTYKKTDPPSDVAQQRFQNGATSEQRHPAGAARPIPDKYDGLSQD
jgi:phage replication O-like protein O